MDGPRHYFTKLGKSDRGRQISYNITYMWNLKKTIQMNLFTKQKQTHRLRELIYSYQSRTEQGGVDWEFGIGMYILQYSK